VNASGLWAHFNACLRPTSAIRQKQQNKMAESESRREKRLRRRAKRSNWRQQPEERQRTNRCRLGILLRVHRVGEGGAAKEELTINKLNYYFGSEK
jgi:hypothetical protein